MVKKREIYNPDFGLFIMSKEEYQDPKNNISVWNVRLTETAYTIYEEIKRGEFRQYYPVDYFGNVRPYQQWQIHREMRQQELRRRYSQWYQRILALLGPYEKQGSYATIFQTVGDIFTISIYEPKE